MVSPGNGGDAIREIMIGRSRSCKEPAGIANADLRRRRVKQPRRGLRMHNFRPSFMILIEQHPCFSAVGVEAENSGKYDDLSTAPTRQIPFPYCPNHAKSA
jgi:hypothetical protein